MSASRPAAATAGRPEVRSPTPGSACPTTSRAAIFEPFFSTKGHKGNGLGLSMCEGIAERHGANARVGVGAGQGTTFTLTFATAVARSSATADESPAVTRSLSVLVVDDRADVCDSLGAMVSALGHAVTKARDGATALDMIIARRFDVLVTDLGMPGMNGLELARSVGSLPAGHRRGADDGVGQRVRSRSGGRWRRGGVRSPSPWPRCGRRCRSREPSCACGTPVDCAWFIRRRISHDRRHRDRDCPGFGVPGVRLARREHGHPVPAGRVPDHRRCRLRRR